MTRQKRACSALYEVIKMDIEKEIKKEIKNLRVQESHNERTGFPDLAEKQNQIADWLSDYQEILDWMINVEPDVYHKYQRYV